MDCRTARLTRPQRAALLLLAQTDFSLRVAERYDREDFVLVRQSEFLTHAFQLSETRPVGPDPVSPGDQDHRLDSAARIRDREVVRLLDCHDDCCARARDVRTVRDQAAQVPQAGAVSDDHEVPGLDVARARGQMARLHDAAHHLIWNWLVLILADGENSADGLKDRVAHFLILLRSAV